jgi:hypothetical protein
MLRLAILIALLPSLALAQPLPQPKSAGGSCPHCYTSSGSFCVPSQGAQDAIPLPPNAAVRMVGLVAAHSVCAAAVGAEPFEAAR